MDEVDQGLLVLLFVMFRSQNLPYTEHVSARKVDMSGGVVIEYLSYLIYLNNCLFLWNNIN